jgi:hypothetical protein
MDDHYEKSRQAAEEELADLMVQKAKIDARITRLRETIIALMRLARDADEDDALPMGAVQLAEAGLTDSIRDVLKELKQKHPQKYHSPTDIRDELSMKGFPLAKYKSEMAAIHNVLARLQDLGEVETGVGMQNKKTYYRWKEKPVTASFGINIESLGASKTLSQTGQPLDNRITERLKKKRPAWAEYLAQNGGIMLANPPYFANGKKLTRRQIRQVDEAIEEGKK